MIFIFLNVHSVDMYPSYSHIYSLKKNCMLAFDACILLKLNYSTTYRRWVYLGHGCISVVAPMPGQSRCSAINYEVAKDEK